MLVISELPGDTIYNLLYPQYYRQYGFDTTVPGWNARNMFSMFAEFDYTLFGTTTFKITDERIFGGTANDSLILTRKPRVGNFRSQSLSTWVQVCITYTIMPPTQNKSITTQSLMGEGSYEICTDYWFFDNGGGGGGGTSGGGSTSGGGGSGGSSSWPDQPPCPAQPKGYVTNLQISDPCSPGWVPNPDPIPTPPEPIDSLLKKYALLSNKYSDSLGNLCETQHKERFFNIVGYNNQLDTFRVLTSPSEDEVKPNYYMTGGRILLGSWHYHPKYPDGTPGSWPSGGDVAQLYDKPKNFIMIIDCVDARYALVVEDVGQMAAWKNIFGNGPKLLPDRVRDSVLADSRVYSTGAIYVQMTKDKIFGALGSSSTSGIGLYEATSSNGITFTKIN